MLHLDYLMISNGGCDPYHYIRGTGGLGYKPSPPFMHGLGYSHEWIDGSGFKMKGRGRWNEDGEWENFDKKELKSLLGPDNKPDELVSNYWYNEQYGPKDNKDLVDQVDEEQQRILNLIYKKNLRDKVGIRDKEDLNRIINYQKEVNESHNKYKKVPTIITDESEETKTINETAKKLVPTPLYEKKKEEEDYISRLKKGEDYGNMIYEKITPDQFKNANDFEQKIAGINTNNLVDVYERKNKIKNPEKTKEELTRARYNADLIPLEDRSMKYVRDAIKLTPLNKEIEEKQKEGYKVKVLSYNTNYDTWYKDKLVFAGDKNFKMDTFVDVYYVKGKNAIRSDKNLLIEEKFYAKLPSNQKGIPKDIQYRSELNTAIETKEFNTLRRVIADELRESKNEINEYQYEYKKSKDKEEKKELSKRIKEKENERNLLKEKLSSEEKIKNYIEKKMKKYIGAPVEAGKFSLPTDYKDVVMNKSIKAIKDKAEGRGGNYQLIGGLTTPIVDKKGEIKSRKIKVITGKVINNNGKEFKEIIRSPPTKNALNFANRYVVLAVAAKDGVYLDSISKKIGLDSRMGQSAYDKNKETSIMVPYSHMKNITTTIKENEDLINFENKKIKQKEKKLGLK